MKSTSGHISTLARPIQRSVKWIDPVSGVELRAVSTFRSPDNWHIVEIGGVNSWIRRGVIVPAVEQLFRVTWRDQCGRTLVGVVTHVTPGNKWALIGLASGAVFWRKPSRTIAGENLLGDPMSLLEVLADVPTADDVLATGPRW